MQKRIPFHHTRPIEVVLITLILALAIHAVSPQVAHAQSVAIGTPSVTVLEDGCTPGVRDPGDTVTIASVITNNTSAATAFRVLFRVMGTTGGAGSNLTVDLLSGGPTYMHTSGHGGANWDDSYGELVNTPTINPGTNYTVKANYSILRQQLSSALNLDGNASTSLTILVEVFSHDLGTYYGSATTTLTVTNTRKNSCANTPDDASAVMLTTNKANYLISETIYVEWSVIGAEENARVPSWGDTSTGTVEIVRLVNPPNGDPESDYSNGTVVQTLASWVVNNSPSCLEPCLATDEDLAAAISYAYRVGNALQAFTSQTSFAAASLTADSHYLVRIQPGGGSSSHPIRQAQWTYFSVGSAEPLAVTLASAAAGSGRAAPVGFELLVLVLLLVSLAAVVTLRHRGAS